MKNTVVGLGEILWDMFPERKVLGGAPANFAYHVSQLGFNGYAVSAIGDDLLGKEILKSLEKKELNYILEKTDFPTGSVKVSLDGRGIPTYEISENVAWDNIPFTSRLENLAKNTDAVCFGSLAQRSVISRATIHKYLELMPAESLKVFDINLRLQYFSKEVIIDSLDKATALKINDEELVKIAEMFQLQGSEEDICLQLLEKYHLKFLILTQGTRGSYVFTPNEKSFLGTPKVTIADTVGAGDSFTAAFVSSYLNGRGIAFSHQLAVEVSAYVCQQHGAMPRLADAHLELFR